MGLHTDEWAALVKAVNPLFAFGSNLQGRHGKGAALFARTYYGAVYGIGVGVTGNSYAIPTKDESLRTLPLEEIRPYVDVFIQYAIAHPRRVIILSRFGCGLAGYTDKEILSLLPDLLPSNVYVDEKWAIYYPENKTWGTV